MKCNLQEFKRRKVFHVEMDIVLVRENVSRIRTTSHAQEETDDVNLTGSKKKEEKRDG